MDFKRYCIVCGNENFSARSKFCCEKCRQQYYYQQNKEKRTQYKKDYYKNNKQECDNRHNNWISQNRQQWNEYNQKRREEFKLLERLFFQSNSVFISKRDQFFKLFHVKHLPLQFILCQINKQY